MPGLHSHSVEPKTEALPCLSQSSGVAGWNMPATVRSLFVLNDREKILSALREKTLKVYEVMKRANIVNEEACQSLLLKMRGEGSVKFDIHKGRWLIA